mgnify:CR=1 FL=1
MDMVIWYNKQTRNNDGKFYGIRQIKRPSGWPNTKNNFTKVSPGKTVIENNIECDWNDTDKAWDILLASQKKYDDSQTIRQRLKNSIFYDVTPSDGDQHIDDIENLSDAKEVLKQMVRFVIGMREILQNQKKKSNL